jgi:hypothetical protein
MKLLQQAAEHARAVEEEISIRVDIVVGTKGIRIKGQGYGVTVYSCCIPWDAMEQDKTAMHRVIDSTVNDVLDIAALEHDDDEEEEESDGVLASIFC